MSRDTQSFCRAAQDEKITGERWGGYRAIEDFKEFFEKEHERIEGGRKSYNQIRVIAAKWWEQHSHRYTGNTYRDDQNRYM